MYKDIDDIKEAYSKRPDDGDYDNHTQKAIEEVTSYYQDNSLQARINIKQASELAKTKKQLKEIREYCLNYKDLMWAATIGGIIDDCDFREFK